MQAGKVCNNNSERNQRKIQTDLQFIFLFKMEELNSVIKMNQSR
jgi:hypothetical protein